MHTDITELNYDESEAVKFIQSHLPEEMKGKFSDDEINYVIDILYEYYEERGLFLDNVDVDSQVNISEDELIEYVMKHVRKENVVSLAEDQLSAIIQGELDYCETLGIFE